MTPEDKKTIEDLRDYLGRSAAESITNYADALTRVLEEAERERVSVECTRNTTGGEGCISFRKYPAAIFTEDFPDPICGMINEAPRGTRFRITCERLPESEGTP